MHVSGKELKKNFSVALALLLTAILPALHLYSIQENPTFQIPVIDSMEYFSAAKKIAGGALLETRLEHLSLLYTWFLASIFSVFGNELLVVKAGQILLNVGSAFFLYLAVLELSSKKEAVVALYIWAFYGPILFFTCEILSIGFILFFYTLSIYMVTLARKQKSLVGWGRAGFVLGLSVLARPDIVLFLGLLGLMLLFSFPGDKDGFKKRAGIIFFFSFFASLPLFLASSITYSSSGEFRFLPADSGLNLFIGNNPESAKSIGARPGLYWDSLSEHPGKAGGDGSSRERNSFYHEAVGAFLLEHFSAFTRNLAFKTMTLVNGYELPSTLDIYSFRKYSVVLTILTWTTAWFSFPWGVLMPLGIVGIWIDRGNKEYRWLFVMCFSFFLSLIGFWNSGRYRMVLVPFFIFFASRAAVHLYALFYKKEVKKAFALVPLCTFLVIVCNVPYQHFSRSYNFEAEMNGFAGIHLVGKEKKYSEAIPLLQKSADLQKLNESVCFGYPLFSGKSVKCSEILQSYNSSLKGHTFLNLAISFMEKGEFEKSALFYSKAIETEAVSFLAYNNFGVLRMKQKKILPALNYFHKAVELRPDYPNAHTNLGIAYLRLGDTADAIRQFGEVIRLRPDAPDAYYNLAVALAEIGQSDEAVWKFIESLQADPERAVRFFRTLKPLK